MLSKYVKDRNKANFIRLLYSYIQNKTRQTLVKIWWHLQFNNEQSLGCANINIDV